MPRPYSMQTRRQQTTTTRARVLRAAVELLAEMSIDALTMQAIAERADVALRTVYNHFPSKEALVVDAHAGLVEYVKNAVAAIPATGSARERLGWFTDAYYDAYEYESPDVAATMGVTGVAELDAQIAGVRAWRRQQLTALLRPADRDKTLRVSLKEAVALAFLWTSFATWLSLTDESRLPTTDAKRLARASLDATLFAPR